MNLQGSQSQIRSDSPAQDDLAGTHSSRGWVEVIPAIRGPPRHRSGIVGGFGIVW